MIPSKIQAYHLQKSAYVYLRQSTMGQVIHHSQSTERTIRSKRESSTLRVERVPDRGAGWGSGVSLVKNTHSREDFKTLVADVSMNKVGAIFCS